MRNPPAVRDNKTGCRNMSIGNTTHIGPKSAAWARCGMKLFLSGRRHFCANSC